MAQISGLHTGTKTSGSGISKDAADIALLPVSCPGCGALVQTVEPLEAGFYSITRKAVKVFSARKEAIKIPKNTIEDVVYKGALQKAEGSQLQEMGLANLSILTANTPIRIAQDHPPPIQDPSENLPLCDRCHNLVHHHFGVPIHHPSIQSIRDTISESPHKFNHVYHVLDAADFPLSLIPNIHRLLSAAPQRSKNRRSKTGKFYKDKNISLNFVITRSDLLAPKKEQVDSLMPYFIRVLRDSLGSAGDDIRLGNVKCVSAKRGWWTKDMKEAIWNRNGGSWMVGRANVGKSNLFEAVFPKGRTEEPRHATLQIPAQSAGLREGGKHYDMGISRNQVEESVRHAVGQVNYEETPEQYVEHNEASLLPPAQPETAFPVMPVISSLPGTTASPIRHSFKNGRGELIDLPGLSRGKLFSYVRDEHQAQLVMCDRLKPEQRVLKPGQSLLLGGLIRITPTTPGLTFLACAFVPFDEHVTSTEKAIGFQTQKHESRVPSIAKPGAGETIASAGKFRLKWDVTKRRAGPITSPKGVGLKVEQLPFRILSTDILIEGSGWVEVVAQVRKKRFEQSSTSDSGDVWCGDAALESEDIYPEVEVFSPEGKGIGARMPMSAWAIGVGGKKTSSKRGRPRPSMKGIKKREKRLRAESK
ncbi:hypothetical protein FGG08_001063 [Glutinoglossum americanum]|uniref:Uncharacterized protein n=1 Tax=Glutinoglossum americanum TaxID=1670608 RepID=A0A9P8I7N5_9PEZI|nr:hypothetical protein FGG08_001063 [Glutinoglossum americanum]